MCLARSAHGVAPNHSIFQGPRAVAVTFSEAPTPASYRKYWVGRDLPDTLQVWQVDHEDYTTTDGMQPGTVSTGHGFLDSPDAEVVAGGINSKSHNAVALGRHGSLFLWGFASAPSGMTPAGRAAFVNSIAYIKRFDHQPRLIETVARDRGWALESAHFKGDTAQLAALQADLEYLRPEDGEGRGFVVDEDCEALGLSNRSLALLDECVRRLEADDDTERATRLLRRYTEQSLDAAAEWRRWLDGARGALFFSDIGGFVWREAVDHDARLRARAVAAPCPKVTATAPVAATAMLSHATARPGDVITAAVRVHMADGWHTYGALPKGSPYRPLAIHPALPEGWSVVGAVDAPASEPYASEPGVEIYTGDAVFLVRLRVPRDADAGEHDLDFDVSFMVCDESACLPPGEQRATATLTVGD